MISILLQDVIPTLHDISSVNIRVIGSLNPIVKFECGENQIFYMLNVRDEKITFTTYMTGRWSGCAPVEGDYIHAKELNISPARHRLEHDLWHHLVGIYVYGTMGSPIIWRDAHGIEQPEGKPMETKWPDGSILTLEGTLWGPVEEEEWLVTALSHRLHGEYSRDHGASIWLEKNRHNADEIIEQARGILRQIEM